MNAVFVTGGGENAVSRAYGAPVRRELEKRLSFAPGIYEKSMLESLREPLSGVEYIFSTWGMLPLADSEIERYFPKLKAVFYAAGSVQGFARPFLRRGIRVFSAWGANAVPVAEYTVAQILLAGKGYHQALALYKNVSPAAAYSYCNTFPGTYGRKIGILGAGRIGSLVIRMLKACRAQILVYDPFLSDEKAAELGAEPCGLEKLFSQCQTVSSHLANNEKTRGILNYSLFRLMPDNAVFINTGRGAQVVEEDLVRALSEKPGRTAVLDVTDPEPPKAGHAFYRMANVFITPHIAGSMNDEIARMGEWMLRAYLGMADHKPVDCEVTLSMLDTMA